MNSLQKELDSKVSSIIIAAHTTESDGTKLATIAVNGLSTDIYGGTGSGEAIVNGGNGSVIDGTILTSNTYDLPLNTLLSTVSYEVKHDCLLDCKLDLMDLTGDGDNNPRI